MSVDPLFGIDISQHASAASVAAALRAATNLNRYSQATVLNSPDWGKAGAGTVASTIDPAVPVTGRLAAQDAQSVRFDCDGTAASQGVYVSSGTAQGVPQGTFAVGSILLKGVQGQAYFACMSFLDLVPTTYDDPNKTNFVATGAWQLVIPAAFAVPAGVTADRVRLRLCVSGTRTESFWVAQPMIEVGQTVVAPYVPTAGAVATRPAQLSDPEIASLVARFKSNAQDPVR